MSSWFCNLSQTILVFKCFADVFWYMYIQVKDSVVGYKKGDRLTLWKTKKLCFSNKFSHNFSCVTIRCKSIDNYNKIYLFSIKKVKGEGGQ